MGLHLPQSRSHWNGKVEQSQHFRAQISNEQIGDDRRCDRAVRCLANAYHGTECDEPPETGHEGTEQRCRAPQKHPQRHDPLARVTIAQVAENWCANHVGQHECRLQQTALVITDLELVLNVF